jgi:hypothetical protein
MTVGNVIVVKFDSNTESFDFTPPALEMGFGNGIVQFQLVTQPADPKTDPASFVSIDKLTDPPFSDIGPVNGSGQLWKATDQNTNTSGKDKPYDYAVTILYGDKKYSSPDPTIVNKSGAGRGSGPTA